MGDNGEGKKEEMQTAESPVFTLTIKFTPPSKVEVNGILTEEMICFYMLEKAKDLIKANNLRLMMEQRNKIIPAKHGIIDFIRRK